MSSVNVNVNVNVNVIFFDFFEKIGMLVLLLCFFSGIAEPNQNFQVSRFK